MNLFCRLFGHKFRPRFNKSLPKITELNNCSPLYAAEIIESSKSQTYLLDICERCGSFVKEEKL